MLERLVLARLSFQVKHALNTLRFTYQPLVGVDDAVICLLQHARFHMRGTGSIVRIILLVFPRKNNSSEKLLGVGITTSPVSWIADHVFKVGQEW